ncbi:PepSY-associated TM helix domain-containing protein [Acetobacter vaccinii]|uniref:PepSY domain-containing protein n=1 Tax=Acetobacter vaccinii TaxID=2592655 RepID=A0A5C1YRP5_9PROT|nr:PepSY-associated TM helix domain-containing protein [Acetobacter vaccinii]QEO17482.1 PepSY domain-containing protein [Acetobacter vaccinii]
MDQDFRRSMGWLHTWAGVVLGCFLFAIFWMGTLSVFDSEIDQWMKPATRIAPAQQTLPLETFRPFLEEAAAHKAAFWNVSFPNDRQSVAEVRYRIGRKSISHDIDPHTGQVLPEAGTLGASGFIFPFHYTLELRFMGLGEWLVGLSSMAMLALCVTGVIIHRKLFADFFTFRPDKKARRVLLDVHNISGVLGLPFCLVITFSGLAILGVTYFPSGVNALYDNPRSYFNEVNSLGFLAGKPGKPDNTKSALNDMEATARQLWGGTQPGLVLVARPGAANARVAFFRESEQQVVMDRAIVAFDAVTGKIVSQSSTVRPIIRVQHFLSGLHFVHFHHWLLRWLYFVLGLGGCTLIATGFLFWLDSRRKKQGATFGFRLVEGLSAGAVTGIILATLAFFVANRLLPPGARCWGLDRSALEVWSFYAVWLVAFVHGWVWPRKVWGVQSAAISLLAVLAVVLNWVTTGDHLARTLLHRWLWPVGGMDMVLLLGAGLALLAAVRLSRKARQQSGAALPVSVRKAA